MGKYKLSVIIPTYNAEKYIDECIKSIMNQSFGFENIEVVLVDDKSTDSTRKIVEDYSNRYENITAVFNNENSQSPSKPRNIGIEHATSDYVMFMDNDDVYDSRMCEVMYDGIVGQKVDVVTCRFIFNRDYEASIKEKTFLDDMETVVRFDSVYDEPRLMTTSHPGFIWNKIFKRDLLLENQIRFPDNLLYEDIYFMVQVYLNANGILLLNDFWGYYYNVRTVGEDKSLSEWFSEKNLIKRFEGMELIFEKLDEYGAEFPSLEGELLVGWTKIFIYTNPEKGRELLGKAKKYYPRYKWNTRLFTIGIPLNVCINVFMKVFPLSITLAVFITRLYAIFFSSGIVSKSRRAA